jgi:hypothetical protein
MSQSKHSRQIVPITLSQIEFAVGLRGGLFKTRSPSRWMDSSSSAEKMLSRSCSRYAYRSSYPTASRNCCRVHSAVGCAVTFKVDQSTAVMAVMFDDDEHIQDSKRAGHRDTEITGYDRPRMIAKEG